MHITVNVTRAGDPAGPCDVYDVPYASLGARERAGVRRPFRSRSSPYAYPREGRIWRSRRTRSSIGGWVENRLAIPPPENGLTM